MSEDVRSTIDIFRKLGVKILLKEDTAHVYGRGLYGLKKPLSSLDAGNSGTTARLMMGILAGQNFTSIITGDSSLRKRPMARVTEPLTEMGTSFKGSKGMDKLPLTITGGELKGINYTLPIPSAQIKSSILLAGLFSKGPVTIIEPIPCRDHTEIMFKYFGLPIKKNGDKISLGIVTPFKARALSIPGDISGAAFFLVAALLLKGSSVTIKDACLNRLRTGIIDVLQNIGAEIKITCSRKIYGLPEPRGDITIANQPALKPFHLKKIDIPSVIDEIPILAVLATQINGTSTIRGAEELRVKETDRIKAISRNLKKLGGDIQELPDGIIIKGKTALAGTTVKSFGDHRMAMSMAIAGTITPGETKILDTDCINISFPGFVHTLNKLSN
jgi:3-phosphoshikimate 1-carboxyvinyltransferase